MQIYENKAFYVICVFLYIRFVECVWVCLRRNHNNSSAVIQMTGKPKYVFLLGCGG